MESHGFMVSSAIIPVDLHIIVCQVAAPGGCACIALLHCNLNMYRILQKDFFRLILIKGNACTVFADQNTALGRGNIHLNGIYGKVTLCIPNRTENTPPVGIRAEHCLPLSGWR